MQDIADRIILEEQIKRHTDFEHTMLILSQRFINMPLDRMDDSIFTALGLIGNYCKVDRSSIWRYDWNKETLTLHYEWYNALYKNASRKFTVIPLKNLEEVVACHKNGMPFYINNFDDLPEESLFREMIFDVGYRSTSAFPLLSDGNIIGVYAHSSILQEKEWDDTEGSIIDIFCNMVTNVLLRKEREEAMMQLNESNRVILNSTNDGIAMFGRDGIILNINKKFAERFGMKFEDIIGLDQRDLLPEEIYGTLHQQRLNKIRKVYDTGEPEFFEDPRNETIYYNRLYPAFTDGKVTAVTLFSTDITDQKRVSEEATKRAEYEARLKVVTDFFTNVSHEFKTPLSIILMDINMIEASFKKIESENKHQLKKRLMVLRQNAHRLLRLVGNILDVSKIDAGFMQVWLQDMDVSQWLGKLVESVEQYAADRGIEVNFTDDSEIHSMPIDGEKLDRIMLNLLSNAIKHTPKGGHISVTLTDTLDKILIIVKDDGEGIPVDKYDIIFDRFKQVNTSLTRTSEGSGIGLALTKALVELIHGRIWFESKVGKGSTFYVELPILQLGDISKQAIVDGLALNTKIEMEFSDII